MSTPAKLPSSGYRYIASVPGVRGGQAIVEGTRIGVHDVIALLQTGESVESVVANCFPTLTRAQVYECLAYYVPICVVANWWQDEKLVPSTWYAK